jgi:hypothetical protein
MRRRIGRPIAQSRPTKRKGVAASMLADVVSVAVTTD